MKIQLLNLVSICVLLAACGGSDGSTTPTAAPPAFACSATDAAYSDTFVSTGRQTVTAAVQVVTGVGADRDWGADKTQAFQLSTGTIPVADIAGQFNAARELDPTIKEKLVMSVQATWDAMSTNDKGLFLVNSERCARGIKPFEGSLQANLTVKQQVFTLLLQ